MGWAVFDEWAKLKLLPWYGGNKIPASYLRKFMPDYVEGAPRDELPVQLGLFLGNL